MQPDGSFPRRLSAGWRALDEDDFRTAEAIARNALAAAPADLEGLQLLGDSLFYQQRFREAIAPLQAVFDAVSPRGVGHRLGRCMLALGEFAQAESVLRRETANHPDLVNAYNALGIALIEQQRRDEALAGFRKAAELDPNSLEAHNNIGNVLMELGRYDAAIPHFRKVTERAPNLAEPHHNLGNALYIVKQYEAAAASYERALSAPGRLTYTLSNLIRTELAMCRWPSLERNVSGLRSRLREPGAAEEPFVAACVLDEPMEQLLCAQGYSRDKFPRTPAPMSRDRARSRGRKLRVGYLSGDFHAHATTYLIAGLLERHDRSRFEITAISYGPDDRGSERARIVNGVDRFVDVAAQDDLRAARILRDLEIDIAVDLKGYTSEARPGILVHRPAPVQIAYLGFPGTSGAPFIDYVLADRFVVPDSEHAAYSEKVIALPGSYQVNDDRRPVPQPSLRRADAGLPEKGFVFCSFNNNFKILPPVFDCWMRLLDRIPGSVLWLLGDSDISMQNLSAEARARGVDPRRIVFAPRVGYAPHLARHGLADLFLDTFPYNAHTTASDALWAGLPVLTCAGRTFASRVAGSLLHALGVPELVTASLPDYESLAARLAADPSLLRGLKEKIARQRKTYPLFDTDRFRRQVEVAYRTAWDVWLAGQAPRALVVEPA